MFVEKTALISAGECDLQFCRRHIGGTKVGKSPYRNGVVRGVEADPAGGQRARWTTARYDRPSTACIRNLIRADIIRIDGERRQLLLNVSLEMWQNVICR
jgi:hypothetical protein